MATKTFKAKVLKQVTLPVHKLEKNQPLYIQIKGPMHVGKKIDDKKEAATLVEAMKCPHGELGLVVCPTIMQKELKENYPGDGYVGKFFEIVTHVLPGKQYNGVTITEIADPTEDMLAYEAEQAKAAKAKAEAEKGKTDDAAPAGDAPKDAATPAADTKGTKGSK